MGRGVKDGRPLAEIRREQKYTLGDESRKVYRRTEDGKLQRLSARELSGKTSDDLSKYYHWLEDGAIDHVFSSSATLCEALAVEELKPELPPHKQKGGRPQEIPVQRKVQALALKKSGGTNKAVAAVLYKIRYPSPQQVRNVSSILRHYEKRTGSPGNPRTTSPPPKSRS